MIVPFQLHALSIFVQGFLLCASLIIAIGPQNLFVLRQGLQRRHLFTTAALCTLCDLLLVTLGIGGMGKLITTHEWLLAVATLGGAAFLFFYGMRSLWSVWTVQPIVLQLPHKPTSLSAKGTMLATLSFSLLNPGAYVDAMMMVGTAGSRYPVQEQLLFGGGAVMASALWFFLLVYGAARLRHLLHRPIAWRAIDLFSGGIMLAIAYSLIAERLVWLW